MKKKRLVVLWQRRSEVAISSDFRSFCLSPLLAKFAFHHHSHHTDYGIYIHCNIIVRTKPLSIDNHTNSLTTIMEKKRCISVVLSANMGTSSKNIKKRLHGRKQRATEEKTHQIAIKACSVATKLVINYK